MKQEIQALLAGTAVALASVAGVPASAAPENVTIVHFNDLDRMGEDKGRGGIARLASVINAEREAGGQCRSNNPARSEAFIGHFQGLPDDAPSAHLV